MTCNSIEERIKKGRAAICLALAQGRDTSAWQQQLALLERTLAQAGKVARLTRERLRLQGWCLWQCRYPREEIIVIARDAHVTGLPPGLPVYTRAELAILGQVDIPASTLRIICAAKKHPGVRIISCSQLPPQKAHDKIDSKDKAHV
jgi:hypothetical protein